MRTYEEFRLVVAPVLGDSSKWTVQLDRCPIPALRATRDVVPTITRAQLGQLQVSAGWPNIAALQDIGDSVWASLLPTPLDASFQASLHFVRAKNQGLRVVVVRKGEGDPPPAGQVGLPEVPFEALFPPGGPTFVALDEVTPISRGLHIEADQPAYHVDPPLRVLLVVAKPSDKPRAAVTTEANTILATVAPLGPRVTVKVTADGTYDTFRAELDAFRPHIVHFIGHGGYAPVDGDPTPRPHLCFVRSAADTRSDPVDGDRLDLALLNREVRLVILTACQSAGAAPALGDYDPRALDGIAQRLVLGSSGVSAAVAMQFDFEADAAEAFSGALYRHLLDPERALDEAVTLARREILARLNSGHRAWVTPVVYWRCREGRVFDLGTFDGVDPALRDELRAQDVVRDTRIKMLAEFRDVLAAQPVGPNSLAASSMKALADVDKRRSEILGQTVRLLAETDTTPAGGPARLRVLLRTGSPGVVDRVRFRLALVPGLSLQGSAPAAGIGAVPALGFDPPGQAETAEITILDPSGGQAWAAGEREVGVLLLGIDPGVPFGLLQLRLSDGEIRAAGAPASVMVRTLEPLLFVTA
jgi:hypothetical protein